MPKIIHIVNISANNGIGVEGHLLWSIPDDLERFKQLTMGQTVLMGRNTWESLPPKVRPLPHRFNMVVSTDPAFKAPGALVFADIESAIRATPTEKLYVIGGERVFRDTLEMADVLEITEVDQVIHADVFYPQVQKHLYSAAHGPDKFFNGLRYRYSTYTRAF